MREASGVQVARAVLAGGVLFLAGLGLMRASMPAGGAALPLAVEAADGPALLGTQWPPRSGAEAAKAVVLIGHGVTENRGVMATVAKGFAAQGYAAVAFDFPGHGYAREGFDWMGNPDTVRRWCAWARAAHPGLPLAYVGHSMGGFAGAEAFADAPLADAFVSLGAMPRRFGPVKTLVAAGQFEELFSPEEARARTAGNAEVLISPWSNHMLEPWDAVLIAGMVDWVDGALGVEARGGFPWGAWACAMLGTALGVCGALAIAMGLPAIGRRALPPAVPLAAARRWSVNPYRIAAHLLRASGGAGSPRSGGAAIAVLRGAVYGAMLALLLSGLLDRDIFTCNLLHPARLMGWAVAALCLLPIFWSGGIALERCLPRGPLQRFAIAAVTRATPLLAVAAVLWFAVPGAAFGGMMLAIFAFILIVLSAIQTLATLAAGDARSGAAAAAVAAAWVLAFWMPLSW